MRQVLFVLIFLMFLPLTASAKKETYTIASSIPFAEGSGVRDNVKEECGFETRLPEYIRKKAKRGVNVVLTDEPLGKVNGKVLFLEITNVFALGGGGYSGSKSAIVSGELKENGELIGSVTARRRTLFSMRVGTCSMLKRVAEKLGEDIADWLREPTMDAKLGDIKDD
ncbi:MAG: hypothetical protein OER22_03245 [Gammaproteobacteria bacterium]|nr:hypothetical protein [Gammaproteobacteria bacterium]MDH3372021.1 hypothetical protein [Gammaproteobacteria bacterium]MDH3409137.1 hypothetical protein [Gammaproteobacteria bacterium]MDH3551609.1 hypothetical protein [Gammaproteobacteria bacterium]